MKSTKIAVGGVYEVRYAHGVNVKAKILRELNDPDERVPGKVNAGHHESQYEVETLQRVGIHAKGYRFKVKARSVKKLVSLPQTDEEEGGTKDWVEEVKELEEARRRPSLNNRPTGIKVALTLRLNNVPMEDALSVMAILGEYDPELVDLAKGG